MPEAVIILGSARDSGIADEMKEVLEKLGVEFSVRVASAHKTPEKALGIIREASERECVFITVAGRSNALSGFTAANTVRPVIAAPPVSSKFGGMDILSSLSMPSGVCPMTVIGAEQAALAAAKILALGNPSIREKIEAYMGSMRREAEESDNRVS